ncbi:hypothetical protein J2X06_003237 [Lysobacter niastensis]|uniref:STAS/SEC14 domain-containing protein n=1 Tax=Lysobacter niastensis TaxID=380629 RepID=A0ABU1WEJ1_9GAMM|nr:hypothetical protein [Lysobacter niastensis]MDR7136019.1 hypothetical protein [Lysobacter niastensis]
MDESTTLEKMDGFAVWRPVGTLNFPEAVQLVARTIAQARDEGIGKLLIVGTHVSGFDPPSVAERHQMVREWADVAEGRVIMAIVMPAAFIDPERFGVIAARNFGFSMNVFESESEAISWLKQPY